MSLHDDLLDECDRHQFLPSDLLQQLVTKERIESHLVSHDIFLAAAILEKILDKGRKLFALLVLLSRETIVDVVFKCFHDDMLPFATIEDVPKEVGDERRRRQFLHFQRSFFPKLTCEDPPQEYSRSPTLPIAQHIQEQGHGSFGVIHKVKIVRGYIDGFHLHEEPPWMAWKKIQTTSEQKWDNVLKEVTTLRARQHDNIVPLVACFSTKATDSWPKTLNLIYPWADMDMHLWLKQDRVPSRPNYGFDLNVLESRKKYLYNSMLSLLDALSYLHRDISGEVALHLDLKPANILLYDSIWKISDFGKSRLKNSMAGSQTEGRDGLGSPRYQPPEYLDRAARNYGRSFDLWAMGCIYMELAILLVHGWKGQEHQKFEQELSGENKEFCHNMDVVHRWIERLDSEDGSPNFRCLMQVIRAMLSKNPEARPYSWEAKLDLEEQFKADDTTSARYERMKELVQQPDSTKSIGEYNPVARALARDNRERVEYLLDAGWLPDQYGSQNIKRFFEKYKPSTSQIQQLFIRAFPSYKQAFHSEETFLRFIEAARLEDFTYHEISQSLGPKQAFQNYFDVVKIWSKEVDVNQRNDEKRTPLFLAAQDGNAVAVKLLLSHGYDVKINFQSKMGGTPLMAASTHGHAGVVRILCESKLLHVDAQDKADQRTALSYAAQSDHFEVVKQLFDRGANPNIRGVCGRTAFSIAAQWSSRKLFELFLELEFVDFTATDTEGLSPLTYAQAELEHLEYKQESTDRILDRRFAVEKLEHKATLNLEAVQQILQMRNTEDPRR